MRWTVIKAPLEEIATQAEVRIFQLSPQEWSASGGAIWRNSNFLSPFFILLAR